MPMRATYRRRSARSTPTRLARLGQQRGDNRTVRTRADHHDIALFVDAA